jgi:hypothetical protein
MPAVERIEDGDTIGTDHYRLAVHGERPGPVWPAPAMSRTRSSAASAANRSPAVPAPANNASIFRSVSRNWDSVDIGRASSLSLQSEALHPPPPTSISRGPPRPDHHRNRRHPPRHRRHRQIGGDHHRQQRSTPFRLRHHYQQHYIIGAPKSELKKFGAELACADDCSPRCSANFRFSQNCSPTAPMLGPTLGQEVVATQRRFMSV